MSPTTRGLKRGSIVVRAMAANTTLGGLPQAAGAAIAGISRPVPLDEVVMNREGEQSPIVGHPVQTVVGFHREARHFSLALPALLELGASANDPREEVGFYLAVRAPSNVADVEGIEGIEDLRSARHPDLVTRLLKAADLTSPPHLRQTFPMGHTGFVHAVLVALRTLDSGAARACIVGGVDSQIDDRALAALLADQRVACGDRPAGLHPGEGAVFLRLERREAPDFHVGLAEIAAVQTANDHAIGDHAPRGEGSFSTIAATLAGHSATNHEARTPRCWFLTDNNGEEWRALDWSSCQVKFNHAHRDLLGASVWHPAASFGDTGAASAPVAAMMAIHSLVRGSAPADLAVVVSASDGGARGAIAFARPS